MNLAAGIQNLKKTVKRLEAAAGKGQRHCAYCRFMLPQLWRLLKKPEPRPEDVLKGTCEFCHSEYEFSIAEVPKDERDEIRMLYTFTLEDQYTNPKAHAFELWRQFKPERKKRRKNPAGVSVKAKKDSKVLALDKLIEEVNKLYAQKRRRLEAKYGDSPFPEHMEIIESVRSKSRDKRSNNTYVQGVYELEQEETDYLICAELEKIIWGKTRAETELAIESIGRQIDDLISSKGAEKRH